MFTDASSRYWAIIITQIPQSDLTLPFKHQRHEPLAFVSGAFKGASMNWSVPEEAFPIQHGVTQFIFSVMELTLFESLQIIAIFHLSSILIRLEFHFGDILWIRFIGGV